MNSLSKIIIVTLLIFLCSPIILATKQIPCDCKEVRTLSLKYPPLQGDDVWELQKQLQKLGFYKHKLNGSYDWQTYVALKKFQYINSKSATGVVKQKTWLKLAKALGKSPFVTVDNKKLNSPQGEISLVVDGYSRQLKVYSNGKLYHTFPVAIGKPSTKSPIGEWAIVHKDADWGGGFGDRWMGLNVPWGKYGIHGTNKPGSIGTAASHGCIRMYNKDVKLLYSWVEVGTRVKIIGNRDPIKLTHQLRPGHTGKDVLLVQERLRKYGFQPGYTDGRFGASTKEAIKNLKYIYGLKDDVVVDENVFYILNLK
ncbi:hypothetical protein Halha_1508 [Halobacteroides halobius DSM 5150]|uniref:L,D-TPase catalytic domain-containing protein n=1 Tax=Halobacteroides halobius (strain ATCC 35273 / DSM 5150 / MD-1) TaxID=748449 RepID=L0KAQ2_HALHC|nr:peptidoglycan-binding protein [Halobacteroides halobius]AGB41449.1 hypothetical protein Halha_1508 [Halobacteroides halobius DSM 5150]